MPKAIATLTAALDKGDMSAVGHLLARTIAPLRAEAGLVEFELNSAATPPEQRRQIREAVAQGRLTLDQAHQMTDLLDKHQAGDEWHPLIERLKRRKAKHAQQPAPLINPVRIVDGKVTIQYPGQSDVKTTLN
jgi:quinol monooxygenase YgiN